MRIVRNPADGQDVRLFDTLEEMIAVSAAAVRPPERLTVSQSAEKYRYLNNPGSYVGLWKNNKTPYLIEPMDTLTSTDFTGMIFVGPARTGKSDMFFNWLLHTAMTDPADMMSVFMTQGVARDWSKGDLEKNLYHEGNKNRPTNLGEKLVPGAVNDNVYDKRFMSGMRLLLKHPTITELSGKTIPRLWVNDADNMIQDVEGKGTPFDLAKKRSQTFKRHGMTVAEGSPAQPITDPSWIPSSPHEAPPAEGLMSLYNRGDRRRWQWCCPQCSGKFEPDFSLLKWPSSADHMEASEGCYMVCPIDGYPMTPDMQFDLNLDGKWIKDGQTWQEDGSVTGIPRRSDIASFWMKGPAAAFTTWPDLVLKFLRANEEYERTGEEASLFTTVTTDQGLPYKPKSSEGARLPETLKARARPYSPRGTVPAGVRFLITTIDVQAGGRPAFVCHTFGIAPVEMAEGGWAIDIYHVDMWKITKSRRNDDDGHPKLLDPAAYKEDWNLLIDGAIEKTYPLNDGSGRHMQVKLVACDSGGAASSTAARLNAALDGPTVSVTSNAYDFWRTLREDTQGRGYHNRFHLLKGEPSRTAPPLVQTFPDSQQKDKWAIARGDVPVYAINSNVVKDTADNMTRREEPGGQVHFPVWYDAEGAREDVDWLYKQLTSEVRLPAGWRNPARRPNEGFDLLAYCVAFLKHQDIRIDFLKWADPPGWAAEWDRNDLVFMPVDGLPFAAPTEKPAAPTLAELAARMA